MIQLWIIDNLNEISILWIMIDDELYWFYKLWWFMKSYDIMKSKYDFYYDDDDVMKDYEVWKSISHTNDKWILCDQIMMMSYS